MKKNIILFISCALTFSILCYSHVNAESYIGGQTGGGSTSTGNGVSPCIPDMNSYNLPAYSKNHAIDRGAVQVTVEWREPGKAKVQMGRTLYIVTSATSRAYNFDNAAVVECNDCFNMGAANSSRIKRLLLGDKNDVASRRSHLETYLKKMNLSYSNANLAKYINKSCKLNSDDSDNCAGKAGLRIIIQNVTLLKNNYGTNSCAHFGWKQFVLYKDYNWSAMTYWANFNALNMKASDVDITRVRDRDCKNMATATNDKNGCGLNDIDITPYVKADYDYSIDAACVGCDVKGLDNRAMIIQDITDWEAIMNSKSSSSPKAQDYYYGPDSGSYCREEYRVKLPDSSKEITVKPGKYLTVGALKKELAKLTKGTANVGPIEVTKIIQCKGGDLNKRRTLNEQRYFINKNGSKSKSLGTIKLKYEECGDNRRYNDDYGINLVPNFEEGFPSVNSNISVDDDGKEMLTQSQTVSYTLPSNTYRYVRNQDGLSIKSLSSIKANDLNTKYRDLGFSTLPISFDNEGDSVKVKANLHFEYTLPEPGDGGAYSAIKEAYGSKNYFKSSGNAVDNVYKKYTKGDAKARTQINKSACNKLYGTTNQACINSHVNDKTADCKTINKISSDKNGSCEKAYSQTGYVCPVKIPPIKPCPHGECKDDWDEENPCENGRPRCADGTCPVDGENCKPCEDDLCTDVPGIKVIYRPIDLANPFPGQKGSKTKSRKTGANWCEYNQKTGKLNCSANNAVSKKYIINKKVYNDNHVLYKVTLDANTISKVRNYNKNKKYDDFDLKCKDGKACISDFLNNVINVEGKCSKVNHGNFYACNK